MGRYRSGAEALLRKPNGAAIIPNSVFSNVYEPGAEKALIAGGSITRLDPDEVYEAEWIAAGYKEPPPEPEDDPTASDDTAAEADTGA